MKRAYPVIFTQTEDVVLVEIPDMGIFTEGKNLENAIEMARDAIGLNGITMQDENEEVPEPSEWKDIDVSKGAFAADGEGVISFVDIDFDIYRRKVDNKMVRRNVTLPNWLNQKAEAADLNVSRVLQDALMQKLNVSR